MVLLRAFILAALFSLTACTRVFFQPSREVFPQFELAGPRAEQVRFLSEDGMELSGLFLPSARSFTHGTVVHYHGNGQNMTAHFLFARWLTEEGFNVFAFDYRGYGKSSGKARLAGALMDCRAAYAYAAGRPGVDPRRMIVFGQSMGGSLAVAALAQKPPVHAPAAFVIEGSFAAYTTIAQDKMGKFFLTWPLQWPLSRMLFASRHHPVKHVGALTEAPKVFIAGKRDSIVPSAETRRLYEAAKGEKEYWEIPEGGHTEAFTRFAEIYRPKLSEFLREAAAKASAISLPASSTLPSK